MILQGNCPYCGREHSSDSAPYNYTVTQVRCLCGAWYRLRASGEVERIAAPPVPPVCYDDRARFHEPAYALLRLVHWRAMCAWLEAQPYNASYRGLPHNYLLARAKRIADERRRLALIFWSTGHGWRLRKDYAASLDAEEQRLTALLPAITSNNAAGDA